MSNNQNNDHGRQSNAGAPSAGGSKAASDTGAKRAAEQGKQFVEVAREGADKLADLREKAAETTQHLMQNSVETASQQARQAAERFSKKLGFSGQDSDRLAFQSKQNIEAITRCGTVLNQAIQDASRILFELGQKQFQRNMDGFNKLTRATSVQEVMTIQSTLVREGFEGMIQDSKMLTETSSRAVDEASKTFANVSQAR
ncbi:phasin family protein [Methylobacterium sp. C25]|uniref:phasin family protein n=1 Tax=Methylobacterium sp. C25 TaxID=2721622 RepID=UPI001F31A080|nr:phasin family protein [Methylobacterium sp. C25]MCE4225001.1 phasin family protein [Methylobacterium sp. C25]